MRSLRFVAMNLLLLASVSPLLAQENFTEGPIARIVLIRITPGHFTEFWGDVRQNLKPLYEEYKRQGIITEYAFFTKTTSEDPNDWNVGLQLSYKGYAALDGLAAKTDPVTLKFYGSRDARSAAGRKRTEHGTTVSSFLIRTVDPKPMAAMAQ